MQYGEAVEATEHLGAIHDWLIDITQTNEASKSIITDVQVPWCLDRSWFFTVEPLPKPPCIS